MRTRVRLAAALVLALVAGVCITALPAVAPQASAIGTPTGCSIGSGGDEASNLCWIDFSAYNETVARSGAGQPIAISLPGGYTATFTLHTSDVSTHPTQAVVAHAFPTYSGSELGNSGQYTGVTGSPALYMAANSYNGAVQQTLSGITVRDASNNPVTSYGFVAADAESSNGTTAPDVETIQFGSDVVLNRIDPTPTVCGGGLTGLGSTSVLCTGKDSTSGKALFVQANSPTSITATATESPTTSGRQAVAFAFVQEQVTLNTVVASRIDSTDSFDSAISSGSTTDAAATTGTGNTATTGSTTVLPASTNGTVQVAESATPATSTTLANYTQSWSCTNDAANSTTALPSGGGTSHSIAIMPGDDITCTVTNTAKTIGQTIVTHAAASDTNGDGIIDAGDAVQYTYTVTNTGATTLTNVGVTDPSIPHVTCAATTLAPNASTLCTATTVHTITDSEVAGGSVSTTATSNGSPLGSSTARTSAPSTANVATTAPAPALALTQTASRPSVTAAGQTITYTYKVTNTGNTPIRSLTLSTSPFTGSGTPLAISCPTSTLAVAAETTCTATYTTTQADVDRGSVIDTVVATGIRPGGSSATSSSATTTTVVALASSAIAVAATADPGTVHRVGETVVYHYAVTNAGGVTLHDIRVGQSSFGGSGTTPTATCPTTTLAPGQTVICTASYVATGADVDARTFTDTVVALGTEPGSTTPLVSDPSSAPVRAAGTAALSVSVTADPGTVHAAGTKVTFRYLVTNTGPFTMHSVSVLSTRFTGTGRLSAITCPSGAAALASGASITCTASYISTKADVAAGQVADTALAAGVPIGGQTEVRSGEDRAAVAAIVPAPASGLATTGFDLAAPLLLAALAIAAGFGLMLTARMRRRKRAVGAR